MHHTPLDIYDDMPSGMKRYITYYGFHFNKKAYQFAVENLKRFNIKTNKNDTIEPYTKEQVDATLAKFKIEINNRIMYDYVYVASICKAKYLGSSVIDEHHLALFVKDTVDDNNMESGVIFRRWMQTMVGNGIPIDWDELL